MDTVNVTQLHTPASVIQDGKVNIINFVFLEKCKIVCLHFILLVLKLYKMLYC